MYIYSNKYCTTGSIDGVKRGALLVLFTRDRKSSSVESLHQVVKSAVIATAAAIAVTAPYCYCCYSISYLAPLYC